MASIKVSPKHGVNPTIPVCFFCGQPKNEIALLGRLKGDAEAPMHSILDYQPCDECREKFSQGVLLIGVTTRQPADGRPAMTAQGGVHVYPTGSHAVMRAEAISTYFNVGQEMKAGDSMFIDHDLLVNMLLPSDEG